MFAALGRKSSRDSVVFVQQSIDMFLGSGLRDPRMAGFAPGRSQLVKARLLPRHAQAPSLAVEQGRTHETTKLLPPARPLVDPAAGIIGLPDGLTPGAHSVRAAALTLFSHALGARSAVTSARAISRQIMCMRQAACVRLATLRPRSFDWQLDSHKLLPPKAYEHLPTRTIPRSSERTCCRYCL